MNDSGMKLYCAFLRGVNVNGKAMKMADACAVFEQAGLSRVASVLASGNLIFASDAPPAELRRQLAQALSDHFAYEAFLFLKTEAEIQAILAGNPFTPEPDRHIYVFIADPGAEQRLIEAYRQCTPITGEAAAVSGGIFYWRTQVGQTLDSGFSKALGRKDLKSVFTSRNINTIEKVARKMASMKPA